MKKLSSLGISALLCALWILQGCSSMNEIRVAGTNFTDEISQTQNLVFTFNKDLIPKSAIDDWDSTQYITFEPAVRGKFRWSAPNELIFSPVAGFSAATNYKAKLSDLLAQKTEGGKDLKVSADPIDFHTPYLELGEPEIWWTVSQESGRQEARVKLIFNYPVNAQQIAENLAIRKDDQNLTFRVLPASEMQTVMLALPETGKADNNAVDLVVSIKKGIRIPDNKYVSSEDIVKTISLPSPLHLQVTAVKTGFESNKGYTRVITTQEIDKESLTGAYTLSPDASPQVELTENGFLLKGDFTETDTYAFVINKTLKGVLGATLQDEVSQNLFFGKMPAAISFADGRALYLSSKSEKNIGVKIVNVPKVKVRISKLYSNNILPYLRNRRWESYAYVDERWTKTDYFNYSDDDDGQFSDVLVEKTVETADLPTVRGVSALNIAVPEDNRRSGVYLVTVKSEEQAYLDATKLVSVSDIGLIVKQGKDEVWIYANSIKTNEPLADLELTLISSNNQTMHTAVTDGNGVAHVDKLGEKAPGFKLALLTASSKEDFNYLALDETQVETSRFEVEGARDNASGFQAFIYGQRDIYRPGETMYFNTVLRTQNWQTVNNIPLKVRMLTPNGREYRTWKKTTNEQGAAGTEVSIDPAALTGTYVFEVYNANDVLLASHNVSVEEFMPDRIKVDLSGGLKDYAAGGTLALTATAQNLFGPPASNRTYEMDMQLKQKSFKAKGFPEYTFEIPSKATFEKVNRQGVTDENGRATQNFVLAAGIRDVGVLEGKTYVTVFDENGRPVNRLWQFDVYTQPVFYGIRLPDSYVGVNAPVSIDVVGVNRSGALQGNSKALVEVVRIEYQTVVEKRYDQLEYNSKKREKLVYSNTLSMPAGKGTFRYAPTVSGEYEIRVRRPGAEHYTRTQFYAYGYGFTQYSSFEVSTEGQVLMETDKPGYKTGEPARILFKTPFDGRLLVTVERNHVFEHHVINTEKKAAEFTVKLKEEHLPNVFITATLIRKLDGADLPLTVAHGFLPVMVEDADRRLPVEITAVEKSRSKQKQHIKVKTAPNSQVTLAVVDEGILQIKNSKTPDIFGHFYQKRALEVISHDLYRALFPELKITGRSSFGGDGYDLERRINPLSNGRTQLVSFWSGIRNANGSGEVTFDIDVPQFSGDLRIMAVAYKDNAFGSSSRNMKVADPVVISAGMPRFLSPGDELTLPVNITNTENIAANATVTIEAAGPLAPGTAPSVQKIAIAPGKETRAVFSLKAQQAIGLAKVTVKVKAFGETFINQTELPVRPASPLLKTSSSGTIAGGSQGAVNLTSAFMPGTTRSQLVLSRSPLVQGGGKALSTLLGYPYGCIEQTISKAFPQLYFSDLTKAMAIPVYQVKTGESDFNPVTNVQQAIRKIESQQLFNGGLGMWPGALQEDWWATAYAVHFLEEARKAGFEVNNRVLSRAVDYLTQASATTATREMLVASTDNRLPQEQPASVQSRKLVARREAIYSLYVLALTGHPNRASMNYYKQNPALLTRDAKYLLAAAFQLTGDGRSYQAILPKKYLSEPGEQLVDDSYSSPLRNMALVLNTLLESDPSNLQIPVLSRQLSKTVQAASYLNTQEAAFAVLALGKLARKTSGSTVTATVSANGKPIGKFDGKETKISKGLNNQKAVISTQGKGDLYWFAQTEGMSATGTYVEEDQELSVRRQYLNRNGAPVTSFKQNDLVVIKLSLSSINGLPIENVVITDLLPAGFEIENPRLTEPRDMPWIKNTAVPEHFDIRDDRIHFFTTAANTVKDFYYQVRVVSKGTFQVGPAAADAMYQGEYRSYSGAGKIVVE